MTIGRGTRRYRHQTVSGRQHAHAQTFEEFLEHTQQQIIQVSLTVI